MGRGAAAWSLVGPSAFGAAALLGSRLTSGYVARDQPISALAAHGSPAAPVMVAGFLGLAAGTLGSALALRGEPQAPGPVPAMLALAGVTTAGAGLARCSDPTCPTRGLDNGVPQRTDDLHLVFSGATFALWVTTPLVAARKAHAADARFRRRSASLGLTTVALLVGGGMLARRPGARWSGWAQRAFVAAALAWQPVAATAARRVVTTDS